MKVRGGASKLAVGGGAPLELAEGLHPLVRLPEQAHTENTDGHDQQRSRHEGHEELGVDLRRHAADGPDERVEVRAQGAPLGGVPGRLALGHLALPALLSGSTQPSPRPCW